MSQVTGPPDSTTRPTLGEQLDNRLRYTADALAIVTDRLGQIGVMLAQQAVDLADFQQALAQLQRRVGRYP